MNVTIEKKPKCLTEVSATFSADTVSVERKSIKKRFANEAQVPGFRTGKVPDKIIEKRYKKEIQEGVAQKLFSQAYTHLEKESDLEYLKVQENNMRENEDGSLSAIITLVVNPEIELGEYKGISVTTSELDVKEEEIQEEIERFRQEKAKYENKLEGVAEEGDIAIVSYSATSEGVPVENSFAPYDKHEQAYFKIGQDYFFPKFSNELIGMAVGSEKSFDYVFAEDFEKSELQGKTFTYSVKLIELKVEELPKIEDLMKDILGEEATEESFQQFTKEELMRVKTKALENEKVAQILEKIGKDQTFELPEDYVKEETEGQAENLIKQYLYRGGSQEQILEQHEEIVKNAEILARKSLKNHFILQEIAKIEGIQASSSEVSEFVMLQAQERGANLQDLVAQIQEEGVLYQYQQQVVNKKVMQFLSEEANVTVKETESSEENAK